MDDVWKKAYRDNRVKIMSSLANPNSVSDILFADGIFTEEMYDDVYQEPETEKKTRLILETLDRRDHRGVKSLYNAFKETNNDELADLLFDYAKLIEKKENFIEPKAWPPERDEQSEMEEHNVLEIKDTESPLMHDYNKEDVYRLHGETRGKVFIINNTFSHSRSKRREGSDVDVQNVRDLFEQLHFDVVIKTDLPAEKMVRVLEGERDKIKNWEVIECVILIIMSHGEGEYIHGNDNKMIKLTEIIEVFDTEHCPGLDEKPRLVFVQACRIVTLSEKELADSCVKVEKQNLESKSRDQLEPAPFNDVKQSPVKHPSADFLVVYATPSGTIAYRNIYTGSWFLNAVVWTFKYHAKREELHHLLIRVNRLVAKGAGDVEFGQKFTVSEVKSNLRKKFYFFPGVYGDSPKLFKD